MKASSAVALMLTSSMAIFGLRACENDTDAQNIEPIWVNGVMGVYVPNTQIFVPHTSPTFNQTCDLIVQNRDDSVAVHHYHWFFYGGRYFSSNSGGASGLRVYDDRPFSSSYTGGSSFHDSEGFHFGSFRGGFGHAGHGHGGGG